MRHLFHTDTMPELFAGLSIKRRDHKLKIVGGRDSLRTFILSGALFRNPIGLHSGRYKNLILPDDRCCRSFATNRSLPANVGFTTPLSRWRCSFRCPAVSRWSPPVRPVVVYLLIRTPSRQRKRPGQDCGRKCNISQSAAHGEFLNHWSDSKTATAGEFRTA